MNEFVELLKRFDKAEKLGLSDEEQLDFVYNDLYQSINLERENDDY